MPLVYLSAAWLTGIALAASFQQQDVGVALAVVSLVPLATYFLWRDDRRVQLWSLYSLFLILFIILGAGRYLLSPLHPDFDESNVAYYNGRGWATLQGVVVGEPDVRGTYTNLRLRAENLVLENASHTVRGLALVRAPRYPEYRYGDKLEVAGMLETPPEFEDFSYRDYLARQGLHSMVRRAQVTLLSRDGGNPFWRAIYGFKARAQRTVANILPEPQASLLTGILLGIETGIPRYLMDDFSTTGTTHIIAISGFNFAIIAGMLSALGARLFGRARSFYFALGGIVLYTLLVGASGAVVRAAVMGGLYAWGVHLGRQSDALNSTMAAALLMTAWNPQCLWDLGFQLSFAATLGLVLFSDPLQRRFEKLLNQLLPANWVKPVSAFLNEALIVTSAAQITTLPIILYNFRQLSLVTLLTNLLILPAQPAVMLWGGVATIAGLIWLPLGQIMGWVAWLFLAYTTEMVKLTATIPYASINLGRVNAAAVGVYYGLLLAGVWLMNQDDEKRQDWWKQLRQRLPTKVLVSALIIITVVVWGIGLTLPDGKLHLVFLDVGQGDAIFIESPTGQQILIDGGPDPTVLLARLGEQMPFWDRTLDIVILTHPDADHLTGLVSVLERYRVGHVFESGYTSDSPTYVRWQELLQEKQITVLNAQRGKEATLDGGLALTILHPGSTLLTGTEADSNNNSIVIRLVMGEFSALLTGDIESEVERELLRSGQALDSTVLKAPHHGADTSSTSAFIQAVNPQVVVISVGQDNHFGHPAPQVLERLAGYSVLRTDERGSIEILSDGQNLWIEAQR
ncbi:MAG: DNA internalization-related competence protein ComEC/Rec2 [Anaerolineaceae bacterium 4572_32.1]|nr:MAG: DNA internalization-related competence protein ComEC/Rec2 [Anaerolineaceae bacterium 4572_32.1]